MAGAFNRPSGQRGTSARNGVVICGFLDTGEGRISRPFHFQEAYMQKWEYKVIYLGDSGDGDYDRTVNNMLDHYGAQGWELVSVDRFRHYFKRLSSDSSN